MPSNDLILCKPPLESIKLREINCLALVQLLLTAFWKYSSLITSFFSCWFTEPDPFSAFLEAGSAATVLDWAGSYLPPSPPRSLKQLDALGSWYYCKHLTAHLILEVQGSNCVDVSLEDGVVGSTLNSSPRETHQYAMKRVIRGLMPSRQCCR